MLFTFSSTNILPVSYLCFDLFRFAKKAWLQKYYVREVKYLSKRQTQLISKLPCRRSHYAPLAEPFPQAMYCKLITNTLRQKKVITVPF